MRKIIHLLLSEKETERKQVADVLLKEIVKNLKTSPGRSGPGRWVSARAEVRSLGLWAPVGRATGGCFSLTPMFLPLSSSRPSPLSENK